MRCSAHTTGCSVPLPASVLSALWVHHLAFSLCIGQQVPTFRTRAWATFTPPPCRTPPEQSAGSPRVYPGVTTAPGFDAIPTLSTRHQRFTCVRLRGPYLTRYSRAFSLNAHHHGFWPQQLKVV